jgi:hypothetical protein
MKKTIVVVSVAVAALFMTSCGSEATTTEQTTPAGEKVEYTCPMHPEVITNEPGDCPKCGMRLEKKEMKMDGADSTMKM